MNQRKRAVWGFILCSLLCCGAGVSAKEAAAGEKAAMPLWTRAAVQYENPYFTGNPDASGFPVKSIFYRKSGCIPFCGNTFILVDCIP